MNFKFTGIGLKYHKVPVLIYAGIFFNTKIIIKLLYF